MKINIKQIIMLTISICMMSILIGFSFAYFKVNNDNKNNQKISIENGSMELTYTDCIDTKDCSNISADLKPGDSITKTFSVKNTGTLDTEYKLIFSKSSNTFVDGELIYTIYNKDSDKEITNGVVPYGDKTNSYIYTESIKTGETKNYKITISFKDIESGNNESNKEGTFNISLGIAANNVWNFDYTGSVQEFTIPEDGAYSLEVWGASGAHYPGLNTFGKGAYSVGKVSLTKNQKLYISIGGTVIWHTSQNYNGGGSGFPRGLSGGGATSIESILIDDGQLKNYKDNIENIILVAGGGGGADTKGHGGDGGGFMGNNGICDENVNLGGSQVMQTANEYSGSFGLGGNAFCTIEKKDCGAAGGGGFYGGNGSSDFACFGGGGSGYIGNSLLTDKHMACYNCETSDEESTKTISVTCASETPTEDCAKIGNGYARITYLGNKN